MSFVCCVKFVLVQLSVLRETEWCYVVCALVRKECVYVSREVREKKGEVMKMGPCMGPTGVCEREKTKVEYGSHGCERKKLVECGKKNRHVTALYRRKFL